jgi:hypothetical protein
MMSPLGGEAFRVSDRNPQPSGGLELRAACGYTCYTVPREYRSVLSWHSVTKHDVRCNRGPREGLSLSPRYRSGPFPRVSFLSNGEVRGNPRRFFFPFHLFLPQRLEPETSSTGQRRARAAGGVRVHPGFRVVAVATTQGTPTECAWLSAETLTLFHFHALPAPSPAEAARILSLRGGGAVELGLGLEETERTVARARQLLRALAVFSSRVESLAAREEVVRPLVLSLRTALAVARRLQRHPADLGGAVARATAALPSLPAMLRPTVQTMLAEALHAEGLRDVPGSLPGSLGGSVGSVGVVAAASGGGGVDPAWSWAAEAAEARRGRVLLRAEARAELVPDGAFVPIPAHVAALRSMARDWAVGAHLLLVGTQVSRVATALMRWDPPAPTRRTGGGVDVTHSGTSPMWV